MHMGVKVSAMATAQEQSRISWWTAWTKRCDDLLYECSAPSISDLFIIIPAFHISGFAHWSCTFVNLVLQRCRCIKACFWFYQNWCKISHEKHSHKGPIISVLYFSNVKKKNYLIKEFINICICVKRWIWYRIICVLPNHSWPIFQCCVQETVYNCHDL